MLKTQWPGKFFWISCCLGIPLIANVTEAATPRYILEKVVLLSRHSIRPQEDTQDFNDKTGRQWPVWLVADGHLSGHGFAGAVNQGKYEIDQWRRLGFLAHEACPTTDQVYVWASPYQRTRATAQALIDGMFPGCGLAFHHTRFQFDPILQAEDMGLSKPDPKIVNEEFNQAIGSQNAIKAKYANDTALLRKTVCAANSCQFLDQPWEIKFNGKKFEVTDPAKSAANMTEVIRMQYSENMPLAMVGFGNTNSPEIVAKLLQFNRAKYDLLIDQPEVAKNGATQLMKVIAAGLAQDIQPKIKLSDHLNAPLILLVGHDNNLSQVRALLGFSWKLHEYPRNDTPPASSIIFERFRDRKTGQRFIRTQFVAQSLQQWRSLATLNDHNPPYQVDYKDSSCHQTAVGVLCPLNQMLQKMEAAQNPTQVSPQPLFE